VPRVSLRPERTLLGVVLVMLVGALPLAFSAAWLLPVLLVPLGVLVWVLRARVEADVRLLRDGAKPLPMTAVTRRDLPRLLEFSQPA
jgi:hypothetical protein